MPLRVTFDIAQNSARWKAADIRAVKKAIAATLNHQIGKIKNCVGVSITLGTNAQIKKINAKWRKKNQPTNVLSFPSNELENAAEYSDKIPLPLGDIVIAYEICARESKNYGIKFQHYIMFLAVHGMLHLLGYDHETDAQHQQMMKTELAILTQLGLANPYPFMQ